jgi:FixJ family two-component response regulator
VLLDVEMPGLSGDGLAELLAGRRETVGVPVIFYSSRAPTLLLETVRESGARGAIQKTGGRHQFLSQFEALLPPKRGG